MNKELIFPCEQCGGKLKFSAATGKLTCPYCGHINVVEKAFTPIVEQDYEKAMAELKALNVEKKEIASLKCPSCAAVFDLHEDTHAMNCPFCGSAVVNETSLYRPIQPQAVLPFKVTKEEAKKVFRTWLDSRWFAPNKLKHYSGSDSRLLGVYVPFWTYDSETHSRYHGRRGDEYQVRESYMATVDGKQERRERTVTKVRWHNVDGSLDQSFDDVLVMASEARMDRLDQWDLQNLVPYDESYLSGFESEVYTVEPDSGLKKAKGIMDQAIRRSIKRQIGGDRQEITSLQSDFFNISFKHVLLPIYASAYRFRGKVYRYVINGRTAEIEGDRPYSIIKIVSAAIVAVGIAAVIAYYSGYFQ